MAKNNGSKNVYNSVFDLTKRAKQKKDSAEVYTKEKYRITKQNIDDVAELALSGREAIVNSNVKTINRGYNAFNKIKAKPDYDYGDVVTKAIEKLDEHKFFDIISGKVQTGEDTMFKAIDLAKEQTFIINNQKTKSNENLYSLKEKIDNFNKLKTEGGSLFVYDLETLGGTDANDIWRPTHITEFSMHEHNMADGTVNKVDILMGWKKGEKEKILGRIEAAIKDGSIEDDNELQIMARRLSMYGDDRVRYHKTDKGYFVIDKFVGEDAVDYKNFEKISKGANVFDYVGRNTDNNADRRAMMEALANAQSKLAKGNAMLAGFNDSLFDTPVMNAIGNQFIEEDKSLLELFENGKFEFGTTNGQHIDFMGMIKHYAGIKSNKDILGESLDGLKETRLNRQEVYVEALYKELFDREGLQPHKAADDVSALSFFFTKNMDGKNETLFDFLAKGITPEIEKMPAYDLVKDNYILEAKSSGNKAYGGRNMLNFAYDNETGAIFTADNHIIEDGKVFKKPFNTGAGLNQGQLYTIKDIKQLKANDSTYVEAIRKAIPEYANNNLYALTLDMVVDDSFTDSRMDRLSQVVLFNSETELHSFLGNTFDVVAKENEDGSIKLINRDAFDIREYGNIKENPVFQDIHDNHSKTDGELYEQSVKFRNKKLATSRSTRAIENEKAYDNITKILNLQEYAEKTEGFERKLTGREINQIMASNVAQGYMPITIDEKVEEHLKKGVKDILGYKGNVLDSTVDNYSTYTDIALENEAYYKKLLEAFNSHKKIDEKTPKEIKRYLFNKVNRELKEELATNIYNGNDKAVKKAIMQDSPLQASLSYLKNMYEIDLSTMPGYKDINYFDVGQSKPSNILRLDLAKTANNEYTLIDAVRKAVHGDRYIKPQDVEEVNNREFRGFIKSLLDDETFREHLTVEKKYKKGGKVYKSKKLNDFGLELKAIAEDDKKYHHVDVAKRIVKEFKAIKEERGTAGIISTDLYMKNLETNKGFINALNGKKFLQTVDSRVKEILDNTHVSLIDGKKDKARTFVQENLLDAFAPKANQNIPLQVNARNEMLDYLTDIVLTADKIGAETSLSDNGELLLTAGGRRKFLTIPRIKEDADSGIWYLQSNNMKNSLYNKLNIKLDKKTSKVDMEIGTIFKSKIGNISKSVEEEYAKHGTYAALDKIEQKIKYHRGNIQKGPTTNNFNGNDLDANNLIDYSDVANVYEELFGERGKLNHLVRNEEFLDKDLQEILQKDIVESLRYKDNIDELGPMAINKLAKNQGHILQILAKSAGVDESTQEIIKNISFTTNDKKMSSMVGIIGDMTTFSPQAFIDNLQRPPVLAAGNAIPIRVNDIKKLEGEFSGVLSGNLISRASVDKKTMRTVAGVGETTTDVMMDIAYVSTNALEVIRNTSPERIFADNTVKKKYQEHVLTMFETMAKMNTYEQERHMDGRVAEGLYGLMPAKVQNISNSKDMFSAIKSMNKDEALKQLDTLVDINGNINLDKDGNLVFKNAIGKSVKRGDSVVKIVGFNDKLESVSSKVQQGVFLHRYQKSNGMTLTEDEITKIINKHKDLFMEDGKLVNKVVGMHELDKLLASKYSAQGIYRIEDMNAAGYIKPTTSSTEKGMTNLNYVKTGELNEDVRQFFKDINKWDEIQGKTLTDNAIDTIINEANKKKLNQAIKKFGSIDNLKAVINEERNTFNEFLYDGVYGKSVNMIVNDGVVKHGGLGQVQFGILNKAIDNYRQFNNLTLQDTSKEIEKIINENEDYQFLRNMDLKTGKQTGVKFEVKDGRLQMTGIQSNMDNLSMSNIEKLENLITAIDEKAGNKLVHTDGYIQKLNEKTKKVELVKLGEDNKLFGEWHTEMIGDKKVYMNPITKESVKLLPDVETQSGTEYNYFKIKETLVSLKSQKNSTNDPMEKMKIAEKINTLESQLRNYESVSKRMSLGTTEIQILERIRVTNGQVKEIQELIDSGKMTDEILATEALKGKIVRDSSGKLKVDDTLKQPSLTHWLDRFKGLLTYNKLEEEKLTAEDIKTDEFKHLKNIYENADKYGYELGKDSAEKLYKYESARLADEFNSSGALTLKKMEEHGFEVKHIKDINFETDEIANKNLIIDLGEQYHGYGLDGKATRNRYIASPALGQRLEGDNDATEILSNGQKELRGLRNKYEQWVESKYDPTKAEDALNALTQKAQSTTKAIHDSIYGKNAFADKLHKVQVDDINYRYKASGAVTSEFTEGLQDMLKETGIQIDNKQLKNSFINGKSLYDWHKDGVHYDYKFVSLEAMEDMGMFDKNVMEGYGINVNKLGNEKAREQMIAKLKKHGTMDITDRYPNNKNDSLLLSHVFLDTQLQGNETKVAGISGLKMNLDHDGDSVSSFALRYKTGDGKFIDYGMFINDRENIKKLHPEAYEEFSKLEATTTTRAITDNKKWVKQVDKILVDDVIKNSGMGDLSKTALVPGGQSILGKIAPSGLSNIGDLTDVNKNEKAVNELLESAKSILETNQTIASRVGDISAKDFNLRIDEYKTEGTEKVLDKALTVMQEAKKNGLISEDSFNAAQANAIKRIAVDKYSVGATAKTGVATTGNINKAISNIKTAIHSTIKDDTDLVNMFNDLLDAPEQSAISYKKIKVAYGDNKGREISEIFNDMFSNKTMPEDIADKYRTSIKDWYKAYASDKVEDVFKNHGNRVLSAQTLKEIEAGTTTSFDAIMDHAVDNLREMSKSEYFNSVRLNQKTRNSAGRRAGWGKDEFHSVAERAIGLADDTIDSREAERIAMEMRNRQRRMHSQNYTSNPSASKEMAKETVTSASRLMDEAANMLSRHNSGPGLGTAVLGLAAGLIASGYASGNPLNDKQASQVAQEQVQPKQTMSVPEFMDKQGGFVTGNSQQGYIINIKADTRKGRKNIQRVMKQAAEASVGGAVSVNMNVRSTKNGQVTDKDIENYLDKFM